MESPKIRSILKGVGTIYIGLIFNSALIAQEFSFQFNGNDHVYTIPGDTLVRNIHLGNEYFSPPIDPGDIDTLTFTFNQNNTDTIEYSFGPFAFSLDLFPTNTFLMESASLSDIDSMFTGPVMIDSTLVEGVRYIDYPGDSLSGFQVVLSGENPSSIQYIQVSYVTQECSDWRTFQPLGVGNIWNLSIPSESSYAERLEIIDMVDSDGSQTWTVAQESLDWYDYSLLPPDTFSIVTFDHDLYKIYWGGDGGSGWLINDFRPFTNEFPQAGIEGVVPLSDGNVGYMYNTSAGAEFWVHGIGITSGAWDGGLSLTLIGYRIDGEVWGNIAHLVKVDDEPITPEQFSLSAYPNPFNNSVNLKFSVPVSGEASIEIYNMIGSKVWSGHVNVIENVAMKQNVNLDEKTNGTLSSGVYLVRITTGEYVGSKKILLLK